MTKNSSRLCSAFAALAAAAGGDATAAPADAHAIDCRGFAVAATPAGQLSNNVWNKQAAGGRGWRQCLLRRRVAGAVQFGWSWQWPPTAGATVVAYPEIVVGAKPWNPGPGSDARFPRRVADTRRLIVSYDTETDATGSYNLAASIWLIRTPTVAAPADPAAVATEIMIWTESAPPSFVPAGTMRGQVAIDGIEWEVWADENWGDASRVHANRWTYVAYRATATVQAPRYDAMKLIADAVGRGFASAGLYIANVELGNEIVAGSGTTWLKRFSVTID